VSDLLWYFPDVLPTAAELAGASAPDDIDGVSIVPELLGEAAAGRKQQQHEYLYWELGGQTALRMDTWKAVRPRNKDWELYDLTADISEENDLAGQRADVLAKMTALAEEAHDDAVEGVFHNREIHERDRRAKWGDTKRPSPGAGANTLPQEGLISSTDWKVARVSSESRSNNKLAKNAFDGDPMTWWHTNFQGGADEHPHELVIDLGREYTIRGFRYLARQDGGWNGAVKECEFYVGDSPDKLDALAAKATLRKAKKAQEVKCPPVRGRYVLLRALSEVNDGPWASAAELGVVGE
ncbi:MAG: discoidin domain-containing protein, partial [Armatimonadota bacterium]